MMDEKGLRTLLDAAAVKRVRIIAQGARFRIEVDAPGNTYTIATGRGALRLWPSLLSSARWLRDLGIADVRLDLKHWTPDQKELPI
jgi:hypothetical protein